jgi:hypothetical protein
MSNIWQTNCQPFIYGRLVKESLKDTKVVNQRRTDNAMVKRKRTKGHTMINKTTKQKSTDRATQSPLETGRELCWSGRVGSCYSTSGTLSC